MINILVNKSQSKMNEVKMSNLRIPNSNNMSKLPYLSSKMQENAKIRMYDQGKTADKPNEFLDDAIFITFF